MHTQTFIHTRFLYSLLFFKSHKHHTETHFIIFINTQIHKDTTYTQADTHLHSSQFSSLFLQNTLTHTHTFSLSFLSLQQPPFPYHSTKDFFWFVEAKNRSIKGIIKLQCFLSLMIKHGTLQTYGLNTNKSNSWSSDEFRTQMKEMFGIRPEMSNLGYNSGCGVAQSVANRSTELEVLGSTPSNGWFF